MPDENGICRCEGTGWDGCKPAKEAPPSPAAQLAAELHAAVQSLSPPIFEQAVEAAINAPRRRFVFDQPTRRAELPAPSSTDTVLNAIQGERDPLHTRRRRHDG
jgi:hypothetical protein